MNNKTCKRLRRLTELICQREGRTQHKFQEIKIGTKTMGIEVIHPLTQKYEVKKVQVDCFVIVNTDGPRFIYQRLKKLARAGMSVETMESMLLGPARAAA